MTSEVTIPVCPVPASRPRVPRYGKPYYTGKYKTFRDEMREWLARYAPVLTISEAPLECTVVFVCKRPAKPANSYPIGDIDNYLKAVWDSLQGQICLQDDKQITQVNGWKRFTEKGEDPHIHIKFEEALTQ